MPLSSELPPPPTHANDPEGVAFPPVEDDFTEVEIQLLDLRSEVSGDPKKSGRLALDESRPGFRAAPLLLVVGEKGERQILVGRWVFWPSGDKVLADAAIDSVSDESSAWARSKVGHLKALPPLPSFKRYRRSEFPDHTTLLTALAKEAAEKSRNTVSDIRRLRLDAEEHVAASMQSPGGESPSTTMPRLVNLSIAVTQARHHAREAVRESMWLWSEDSPAYHAYRRRRDATLINQQAPADIGTRPWIRTHDAAVRQCEAMSELLGEEIEALRHMMQAAGVMAQLHDAEAADTLNAVAAAAAVGIGLPSLGLAYYGADRLFSLDAQGSVIVLSVLLGPTLIAVLASLTVGRGHTRKPAFRMAIVTVCLLLCLSLSAIASRSLGLGA